MPRLAPLPCTLLLFLCAGVTAAEDDATRQADLEWVSGKPGAYQGRVVELKPLSKEDEDGPHAGELPFGPAATLRFRVEKRDKKFVLLIDRDFDGNLPEEKPVELTLKLPDADSFLDKYAKLQREATEEVQPPWAQAQGVHGSVRVHIRLSHSEAEYAYRVRALLHRRGRVELAGRMRMVTVHDGDGDLRFDDPTQDLVFLDTDGDRSVALGADSLERVRPGEPLRVRNGNYVGAVVGPFAAQVVFTPTQVPAPHRRPWTQEKPPPAGRKHKGKARPLPQIMDDYVELKGQVRRRRRVIDEVGTLIEEAGNLGSKAALAFLERAYTAHTNVRVRMSVAFALGDVRYRAGAPLLRRIATKAKDTDLAQAAIQSLHRMDAPGRLEVLVGIAKKTRSDDLFGAAVRHLAYLGTPESTTALRALIRSNRRYPARAYKAYAALTKHSLEPPEDDLITLVMAVKHRRLRALAMTHAVTLPHPRPRELALALLNQDVLTSRTSRPVVEALGRAGDEVSIRALIEAVPHLDAEMRDRMVRLLQPVRDVEATAVLLKALSAKEPRVRLLAARIAAGLSGPAIPELLGTRIVREDDADVRLALAYAIRAQDAKSTMATLLKVLASSRTEPEFERVVLDTLMHLGLGDPSVVRFLMDRANKSSWEHRLRLMDAAIEQAEVASAPILIAGLDDKRWVIRLVAAQGLQIVRAKAAVPPLIDRLRDEEQPRVRRAVELALFKITGMNLYDQEPVWRRWWTEKGAAFEVPAEVGEPPSSDRTQGYGKFFGIPVDMQRVIFVIDQSGSMDTAFGSGGGATDFQRAVQQTWKVIEALPDGAFVNVIFFESDVHPWKKGLAELSAQTRKALQKHLEAQGPQGATNLFDALEIAVTTPAVETIYVLSDGSPTSGKYTGKASILEKIGHLNWGTRAVIHCVAMGWDSDLLRDLAEQNDGTYAKR